jgi:sensor histidine kinase YesM
MKASRVLGILKAMAQTAVINQMIAVLIAFFISLGVGFQNFWSTLLVSAIFSNSIGFVTSLSFSAVELYFIRFMHKKWVSLLLGIVSAIIGTEIAILIITRLTHVSFYTGFMGHFVMIVMNTIIVSIVVLLLYIYYKMHYTIEGKEEKIDSLELKHTEAQLHALQSKLNPHFLFNTLNIITELVYKSPEKVEEIVLNLSEIYRFILSKSDEKLIPVKEELDIIRKYCAIEKARMGERLRYEIMCKSGAEEALIPPLLLEVLAENAVIHGLGPKKEGGTLQILVARKGDRILCMVEDDGVGFGRGDKNESYGLKSVRSRLQLQYGGRAEFSIASNRGEGSLITVEIPYEDDRSHR